MVASRKTASKKTTSKAAPKKTATRSKAKRAVKQPQMQSFHIAKDDLPFTTFRVTRQTLYWVVLVSFIIFAQLWIISLQVEIASLLDAQQAQLQEF